MPDSSASVPVMNTSTISPSPNATPIQSLTGYCNATDADNDTLFYEYKWYRNGIEFFNDIAFKNGSLSTGGYHVCAIRANDSRVMCWGMNDDGQVGDGTISAFPDKLNPTPINDSSAYKMVSAGGSHTCAIRTNDSRVMCWGGNSYGQLGNGTNGTSNPNPQTINDTSPYRFIAAGEAITCGIRESDSIALCWGDNSESATGTGLATERVTNPTLINFSGAIIDISTHYYHTCAIRANDSRVMCWGNGWQGMLGTGSETNYPNPTPTSDTSPYKKISVSSTHTSCGIRANDSRVLCWGSNTNGELGNGSTGGNALNPTLTTDTSPYLDIEAGSCGVRANDSRALCWGTNSEGQIGNGSTGLSTGTPTPINDSSSYAAIEYGCGIRANDSRILCWGYNYYGYVGDGTQTDRYNPTLVNSTASFAGRFNQSTETAINFTISTAYTTIGENWTLSCNAYDGYNWSGWMNSTPTEIVTIISECGNLATSTTLYNNVSINGSTCFTITAANVTLDCNGYTITGNNTVGTSGVYTNQFNSTVKNCIINSFHNGIYFNGADNGTIENNNLNVTLNNVTTEPYSISLYLTNNADYNKILNNTVHSEYGTSTYVIGGCRYTNITGLNTSSNASYGTYLTSSEYAYVKDVISTSYINSGFRMYGGSNNTINNVKGISTSGSGVLIRSNSVNNTFINMMGTSYNSNGIYIYGLSNNNNFINLTANSSTSWGMYLENSNNNRFTNSTFRSEASRAIATSQASGNTIENSLISGKHNTNGAISIGGTSQNNTLANSTIDGNNATYALIIGSGANTNNTIKNNTIMNATNLIAIASTSGQNTIYWNNLTNIGNPTRYVYDQNGSNHYNYTVNGQNEGNIYENVINGTVEIIGTEESTGHQSLYVGDSGTGYPYNTTTSLGKFDCSFTGCADYAPLTTMKPNGPPTTSSARISPSPNASDSQKLLGYCNATDDDGNPLNYSYIWYRNAVLNTSGNSSESYVQGFEINVANMSAAYTTIGDNWTFSCRAFDGEFWGDWVNSTATEINISGNESDEANIPVMITSRISPSPNATQTQSLTGYCNATDADNDTLFYEYKWYRNGVSFTDSIAFKNSSLSTGGSHACAIRANDSRVMCWGMNDDGQVGDGTISTFPDKLNPTPINDSSAYKMVSAGGGHTCGIRANDSRALCWGSNTFGELGNGTNGTDNPNPTLINDTSPYFKISLGEAITCGIRANDSRALCWGYNAEDATGTGLATETLTSPTLINYSGAILDISTMYYHTCAIRANDSRVMCWGNGWQGVLGTGSETNYPNPTPTSDTSPYKKISVSSTHTSCGIRANDSRVLCWGSNSDGQIGNGSVGGTALNPTLTTDTGPYIDIDAGSCGLRANDSRVLCWGTNSDGQIGNGSIGGSTGTPTPINDSSSYAEVEYGCGIRFNDSRVLCWGDNYYGFVGDGTTTDRPNPTPINNTASFAGRFNQSTETAINFTISTAYTSTGENWTLSCNAYDGYNWSGWMNSTPTEIVTIISECGSLATSKTLYNNVSINGSTCFTITAANVTLDCDGYSIIGNNTLNAQGVYTNQFNTTVRNCKIIGFDGAIYFNGADNGTIENNDVNTTTNNVGTLPFSTGIMVQNNANYNKLVNNTAYSQYGVGTYIYSGCSYTNITVLSSRSDNDHGTYLAGSQYGYYEDITSISDSDTGFRMYGGSNNTIINVKGISTSGNGILIRTQSENNTFINALGTAYNNYGVYIYSLSHNNYFINLTANSSTVWGMYLENVKNNRFTNSTFRSDASTAIVTSQASGTTIENSLISGKHNTNGAISIGGTSQNNTIANNTIDGNNATYALIIGSGANTNNTIKNNTIMNATNLAYMASTSGQNIFYWNNFTNIGNPTRYVYDLNGTNHYNYTINGQNEGNIYGNVMNGSVEIIGTEESTGHEGLFVGDNGTGYPYNITTSLGKFDCSFTACADYAPLSAVSICTPPLDAQWNLNLANNCTITGPVRITTWNITSTGDGVVNIGNASINYTNKIISTIVGSPRIVYWDNITILARA